MASPLGISDVDLQIEQQEARLQADKLDLVGQKVRSNRDRLIASAAELLVEAHQTRGSTHLSTDEFGAFKRAIDQAARYEEVLATVEKLQSESRTASAIIGYEPRTYGPARPENSFYMDLAYASSPGDARCAEAQARLARHTREVATEMKKGTTEGRRARRAVAESVRSVDAQANRREAKDLVLRAMTSSSSSGGTFVTPQYVIDQWALWREANGSFAAQCRQLPLPDYGLEVYLPALTSGAQAGAQSETYGADELDPTAAYLSAAVQPMVGQVTISQQLYDRGGMPGMSFDQIVGVQLQEEVDKQIDAYVIAQALANAGSVSDSSSFTWTLFLQDVAKARESLSDTAGTRLLATHIFSTSDLFGYCTRQVDSQNRPILTPDSSALVAAAAMNDPKWASWTGVHLGQAAWHTDDNIPASGSNTQILVARPSEVFVWSGEPIPFVAPEANATTLSMVVSLRQYVASIPRFSKAVAAISGATYPTTLV